MRKFIKKDKQEKKNNAIFKIDATMHTTLFWVSLSLSVNNEANSGKGNT